MNERIEELRKAMGLTLKDFGQAIGLSTSGLSEITHGRSNVTERVIKLILSAFPQVSESWLRTGDGSMYKDEASAKLQEKLHALNFEGVALEAIAAYQTLPADVRESINRYIRVLVARLSAMETVQDKAPDYQKEAIIASLEEQEKRAIAQSDQSAGGDTATVG